MEPYALADGHYTWLIACVAILFIFSWPAYNIFYHPLSTIPGPRRWAATGYFYARSVNSGKFAQQSLELHLKYGPIVRVAPNHLSVTSSESWTQFYTKKVGVSYPKSALWFALRPNGAYGLFDSPNTDHTRFRRIFAQAFTEKSLNSHSGLIDKHVGYLVDKLRNLSTKGNPVNITDELEYTTFDIAGDLGYSRSFNCLYSPENRGQIEALQQHFIRFTRFAMRRVIGIHEIVLGIEKLLSQARQKRSQYQTAILGWTRERLASDSENSEPDMMDYLAASTNRGRTISPEEAENSVSDFMLAGTETISTTVDAALLFLVGNPDTLGGLKSELLSLGTATPTQVQLGHSQLLNAVINETMRLAPSIPWALPRTVLHPGTHVNGHHIPAGTGVSFNQYAAYRDPVNFSSPTKFDAQRWLEPSAYKAHNTAVYNPFSTGPRNCIGKLWGLWVTRTLLAQIVMNFDLERHGSTWQWEDQKSSFVWKKQDLYLTLRAR